MKKPFIVANVRKITDLLDKGEITYSRMVEMLNEIAEKFYEPKWISVEDRPLIVVEPDEGWFTLPDGDKEFIAAIPYADLSKPDENNLWWIRHCVIDNDSLCIVGDVDNELCGYNVTDITHWMPLPEPPKTK